MWLYHLLCFGLLRCTAGDCELSFFCFINMSLADELLADLEDDTDVPLVPIEREADVPMTELAPITEGNVLIDNSIR